jgi:hypothetical protein
MMKLWRSSLGELLRHQVLDTVLEVKGTGHSRPKDGQNCTLPNSTAFDLIQIGTFGRCIMKERPVSRD